MSKRLFRRTVLCLCSLAAAGCRPSNPIGVSEHALTVETLLDSGPSSHRADIVILGDGYRDVDQAQLTTDAQALLSDLFSVTPYAQYQPLFNVKLVHVISNENGADQGSYGTTRDTALEAAFNCSGVSNLICVNNSTTFTIAFDHVPEADVVIVVVNDPMYGGSGGSVPTASIHADADNILVHELGHTFANLADEFETPFPGYPGCSPVVDCFEPNATVRTVRADIKWNAWIDGATTGPHAGERRVPGHRHLRRSAIPVLWRLPTQAGMRDADARTTFLRRVHRGPGEGVLGALAASRSEER